MLSEIGAFKLNRTEKGYKEDLMLIRYALFKDKKYLKYMSKQWH